MEDFTVCAIIHKKGGFRGSDAVFNPDDASEPRMTRMNTNKNNKVHLMAIWMKMFSRIYSLFR